MKKKLKYIGLFLFFLTIFILSPRSGDDWENYLVGSKGILYSLKVAKDLYFNWEGRFISRILINILTYHKWLWNIINSLLVGVTVCIGIKYIGKPKKIIFPLMILVILMMNIFTFSQSLVWIAGNITYFFIMPIILWYFYNLINNDNYNKIYNCLFLLINLFGTMFVEHMGLVLIIGNILVLIYKYVKNKKVDAKIIFYLILSILSTLIMLISPGSRFRSNMGNTEFNQLNIIQKVIYNVPNFVYYTFIVNYFMLGLISYCNYLIIKNKINNKCLKYSLIFFMLVGPLFTIILYPLSMFTSTNIDFLINQNNLFVIIYWLLYLVFTFSLIVYDDKKDFIRLFLFVIGVIANVFMMVSPTWGFRTSLFTYVVLSICFLRMINKYIKDGKLNYLIGAGVCFIGLFYLIFYINIYRCQKALEFSIKEQVSNDADIICLEQFPGFAPCNINPRTDYHKAKYKIYYNIPSDKELIFNTSKWKYMIIYSE